MEAVSFPLRRARASAYFCPQDGGTDLELFVVRKILQFCRISRDTSYKMAWCTPLNTVVTIIFGLAFCRLAESSVEFIS
jgi:hypothetical protein